MGIRGTDTVQHVKSSTLVKPPTLWFFHDGSSCCCSCTPASWRVVRHLFDAWSSLRQLIVRMRGCLLHVHVANVSCMPGNSRTAVLCHETVIRGISHRWRHSEEWVLKQLIHHPVHLVHHAKHLREWVAPWEHGVLPS
jgi:hypothetical protein